MNPLQHLKLIKDNPGVYQFLKDEDLADLLLQLLETKSLFKKASVELKNGEDGKPGKDGKTPKAGVDYMSRKEQETLIKKLVAEIPEPTPGKDGADAEITPEDIAEIVDTVYDRLFPQLPVPLTAEEIRDRLELLVDDERLEISSIKGLKEELEKAGDRRTTALIARYLGQIGDVDVTGATDGQVLTYDATNQRWVAQTPTDLDVAAEWGNITGTLSDQTDLQAALDDKMDAVDSIVADDDQVSIQPTAPTVAPYSIVHDQPTTNLIENPKFENNITDFWSAQGAATLSRDTSESWVGSASMQIDTTVANVGTVSDWIPVTHNETYVFSCWVKGAVGGERLQIELDPDFGGSATFGTNFSVSSIVQDEWRQVRAWIKPSNASVTQVRVKITSGPLGGVAAQTIYIDGCQFEHKELGSEIDDHFPSAYCDGDMGIGHSWSGTANNSTSVRTAGTHFLAPVEEGGAGSMNIRKDGTFERVHGRADSAVFGQYNIDEPYFPFQFTGDMQTGLKSWGQSQGVFLAENIGNGIASYVKSNVTNGFGAIFDFGSLTSGTGIGVYAPADLSSMVSNNGKFFEFADKDQNSSHTWAPHYSQSGAFGLSYYSRHTLLGGGGATSTATAYLAGTVSVTNGSAVVTGVGTTFLDDFHAGDRIVVQNAGEKIILSVDSDTQITATTNYASNQSAKPYYGYEDQHKPGLLQMAGSWGDHNGGTGDHLYSLFPNGSNGQLRVYKSAAREDVDDLPDENEGDPLVTRRFATRVTRGPSASSTETAFITGHTVPGFELVDTSVLRIKFFGDLTALDAATTTLQLQVKLGGTTVSTSNNTVVGSTNLTDFSGEITIMNSNGNVKTHQSVSAKDTSTSGGLTFAMEEHSYNSSVDLRIDNTLEVTAKFNDASTLSCRMSYIELI